MEKFLNCCNPAVLWVVIAVLFLILLKQIYKIYRLKEASSKDIKQEKQIVSGMLSMVDCLEGYDGEHSKEVALLAVKIGRALGLDKSDIENLYKAALLHDVGEILFGSVPLNGDAPLDKTIKLLLEAHPCVGERFLAESFDKYDEVPAIIRWHHEHWDGLGYPDGLRGSEIPRSSRILALADAITAMKHVRNYRKNQYPDNNSIIAELQSQSGFQLDPELVKLWISLTRKEEAEEAAAQAQREAQRIQNEIDRGNTGNSIDISIGEDENK